jgi:hypothetical protein
MEVDMTMEDPFTEELQQSKTRKNLNDSYQGPGLVVLNRIVTLSLVKLPVLTVSRITGEYVLTRVLPALRTTPNFCYNFVHIRSESQELYRSLHHVNGKDAMAIRYVSTMHLQENRPRTGDAGLPPGTVSSTNLSFGKGITDPEGKSFFGSTPFKICNNTGTDGAVYV